MSQEHHKHEAVKTPTGIGLELRVGDVLHGTTRADGDWWAWDCARCPATGTGHPTRPAAWRGFIDHEKLRHPEHAVGAA